MNKVAIFFPSLFVSFAFANLGYGVQGYFEFVLVTDGEKG